MTALAERHLEVRDLPHPGIFDKVESRPVELAEDIRAILRVFFAETTFKVRTRAGHASLRDCFQITFYSTQKRVASEVEALVQPLVSRMNTVAGRDFELVVENGI